jgi:2'-deoxycytidine 5'-triphosphate deaminase (DCD)
VRRRHALIGQTWTIERIRANDLPRLARAPARAALKGTTRGGKPKGAKAVLEARSLDIPFILEDGQTIGRLLYKRLADVPEVLYGQDLGSSYQAQGLKLSKHFR